MKRDRIILTVYVDLDPVPGTFHSKESAQNVVRNILMDSIPHYNPMVAIGHESKHPLANDGKRYIFHYRHRDGTIKSFGPHAIAIEGHDAFQKRYGYWPEIYIGYDEYIPGGTDT